MTSPPRASVIIPTRNRASELRDCLSSLTRQTMPPGGFEVVVVDNGSSDDTATVARSFEGALRLRLLQAPEPGLHVGRHAGAQAATSDVLLFCDDDILADAGWVDSVAAAFESDPGLALVGGNNRPGWEAEPPPWLAHAWSLPAGPWPGCRAIAALSVLDFGTVDADMHPRWVWGCNFSVRRQALEAAGGFHPDGVPADRLRLRGDGEMHVGEVVVQRGWRCRFVAAASVTHRVESARMTSGYFARRARMQGVSDSYTAIRNVGRVPSDAARWSRPFADALRSIRDRLTTIGAPEPVVQWRTVQALARRGWREGWEFHRAEVARDPSLLAWVLKPDYR